MSAAHHKGPRRQNYATPPHIVAALERELGARFALDACASKDNAKADVYLTEEENGLHATWRDATWCNPPYNAQGEWLWTAGNWAVRGVRSAVLVQASTSASYWLNCVWERAAACDFFHGRISFLVGGKPQSGTSFASALVLFGPWAGLERGRCVVRARSAKTGELLLSSMLVSSSSRAA